MSSSKFIKGTLLLSVAGVIVKLLGALYRIPLVSIIGNEGMSYYQTAYPIYSLLLTISTTGLPVAVAKMISERTALEDYINADRIFKLTSKIMFFLGALTAILVYFFAEPLSEQIGNPKVYYALVALVPALFAAPILSSFRGFFQGRQNMLPTALSQITEQIARVILGLSLAVLFLPKGIEYAAGGASFGGSVGVVIGLLTVLWFYMRRRALTHSEIENSKHKRVFSTSEIIKTLMLIAIPITLGAAITPLTDSIDAMLFPKRLEVAGYSLKEANELHGNLKGMAQTLINFPLMFLYAISVSLVPAISEACAEDDAKRKGELIFSGLRLSSVISLPSAMGLFFLAFPIIHLLYGKVSMESQLSAASLLQVASFQLIFLGIIQATAATLQGAGQVVIPARNMLIGAGVKIILSYVLMGIPSINIYGMTISSLVCFMVVAFLNYKSLESVLVMKLGMREFSLKPFIASLTMGVVVYFIQKLIYGIYPSKYVVLISVLCGVIIYFILLIALKTFREEDFLILPKGEKIIKILKKRGLI